MRRFFGFLALVLPGFLLSSPARADLTAWVSTQGSVQLSEGGLQIGSLVPGLIEIPWDMRSFEGGLSLKLRDGGAEARCAAEISQAGQGFRAKYSLSTDKDAKINQVKLSLTLDINRWTEGTWTHDKGSGSIPKVLGETHLNSDLTKTLTLQARDGSWLKITSPQPLRMMVQDSRQWGPSLEIRMGEGFGPDGGTWKASSPVAFDISVTASKPIKVLYDKPVTLAAGPDWIPLENKTDIVAGSALDFSGMGLTEAPAGKYGRLKAASNGSFEFEGKPGVTQRFYGVNFCFSALYLEKAQVDRLMDRLIRLGYNSIRIHHYEGELSGGWGSTRNSLDWLPEKLDQLDYFFAAAKKRGIYMTTDLYVSRPVKNSDLGLSGDSLNFKILIPVYEPAFENWKAFVKKLLSHKNPYTDLTWAEDPALAWLVPVNEDDFLNYMGEVRGKYKDLWTAAWNRWRHEKRGAKDNTEIPETVSSSGPGLDLACFMADTHLAIFRREKAFLRKELGCRALISGLNAWTDTLAQQVTRSEYDYVDNHFYWDHPSFLEKDWQLPSKGWSGNGPALAAGGAGPKEKTASRLLDKPFTLSEFNYAVPNSFRAEGGLLTASAAALQGWNVLWRFAYSHSRDNLFQPSVDGYFDMATDPVNQASERAGILLFLRGDLKTAPHAVALVGSADELLNKAGGTTGNLNFSLNDLTFFTRAGSLVAQPGSALAADLILTPAWAKDSARTAGAKLLSADGLSADIAKQVLDKAKAAGWVAAGNRTDFAAGRVESETGEVFLDSRETRLQVSTPRSFAVMGLEGAAFQGSGYALRLDGAPAAIFASSLDGRPLSESGRILLAHVTDVQATGRRFRDGKMSVLEDWGHAPHLIKAGRCALTLTNSRASSLKVWALATDGSRVGSVASQVQGSTLSFTASTQGPSGGCLYYEIAEK